MNHLIWFESFKSYLLDPLPIWTSFEISSFEIPSFALPSLALPSFTELSYVKSAFAFSSFAQENLTLSKNSTIYTPWYTPSFDIQLFTNNTMLNEFNITDMNISEMLNIDKWGIYQYHDKQDMDDTWDWNVFKLSIDSLL